MLFQYTKVDTPESKEIEKKLKENGGYCPCALVHTDDYKCMCKEFRNRDTSGYCHCGLYYKKAK
nr:hypothetical protein DGKKSRWO_DGKKSRWO_CDS_0134 [uncultured phage]CAI9752311.1 hypothetical protein CVNMHQAP_CVNMHQAP_CDS_0134 [uncultured phage]